MDCPLAPVQLERANAVAIVDVAHSVGISFRHDNEEKKKKYLIETMGSGCGWIDYDQNGLLDFYMVNGAATRVYTPQQSLRSALYRNNGDGTFTDVTAKTGVGAEGLFGMGVAVGDYDNDGFPDMLVLGYGRAFSITTTEMAPPPTSARTRRGDSGRWASSAAWFDYDNDGRLDLVIANYVDWSPSVISIVAMGAWDAPIIAIRMVSMASRRLFFITAMALSPTSANPQESGKRAATVWAS
jgi:hypothetical protein